MKIKISSIKISSVLNTGKNSVNSGYDYRGGCYKFQDKLW